MNVKLCVLLGVACILMAQCFGAPCLACSGKGGKDVCNCVTTVVKPPPPQKLPKFNKSLFSKIKFLGTSYGGSKAQYASHPIVHSKSETLLERPPLTPFFTEHPHHASYEPTPYGPPQRTYRSHPALQHAQTERGRDPETQQYATEQLDSQRPYRSSLEPKYAPTQSDQERTYRSNLEPQQYSQTQSDQERTYRSNLEPQQYSKTQSDQERTYRSYAAPQQYAQTQSDQERMYRSNVAPQQYTQTQSDQERTYRSNLEPQQYSETQPDQERTYRSNVLPQQYAQTQSEQERSYRSNLEPQQYALTQSEQERSYRSNLEPQQYAQTQSEQERSYRSNLEPQQYAQTQSEQERSYRSNLEPQQYAQTQPDQERTYRSNVSPQQYAQIQSEQERTYRSSPEPQSYAQEWSELSSAHPRDSMARPYLGSHLVNKRSEDIQEDNSGEEAKSRISKRSYPSNQATYEDGYRYPKADPVSLALAFQLAKKLERMINEEQIHGYDTIPLDGTPYKSEKEVAEDGLQNYENNVLELRKDLSSYGNAKNYANEYDARRDQTSLPRSFHSLLDIGYQPITEQALDNYETAYYEPSPGSSSQYRQQLKPLRQLW